MKIIFGNKVKEKKIEFQNTCLWPEDKFLEAGARHEEVAGRREVVLQPLKYGALPSRGIHGLGAHLQWSELLPEGSG